MAYESVLQVAIDALAEIAYLLRQRADESHRSRAFVNALAMLVSDRPDLEGLRQEDRLESLPGVGPSIGRALAEVVDTGQSSYLGRLRTDAGLAAEPEGESQLALASYRGDLHSHSTWSDGKVPIAEMARSAAARGWEYLAVTDHSPRITVVNGLDGQRLRAQAAEIGQVRELVPELSLLQGIEVDILEDGTLDLPDEVLAGLDVVIASPHVKLRMDRSAMTERMLRAVENPNVDIVGHPTGRRLGSREAASYDYEAVFRRAAELEVVMEIDCDPARCDLSPELARLAAAAGCRLSLDSDAHAPNELAYVEIGIWMARRAGLAESQVLNWGSADDVRRAFAR